MRISSTLFFQTGLNSINAQQSDLMHLYQQIGSGQRMVTPADDPLAAAQAINISQSQSLNARFAANREVAKQNLGIEENALNSVTTLIQDIKTRLVEAGNGTLSDADRATLSNVLSNARSNLLGLANSTDGSGQYLFSGAKGETAAYQDDNGKIVYKGDEGQRKIQADQTRQIAGSDVGSDIFNRAAPGTQVYLSRAVPDSVTGLMVGTGVISTPTLSDPSGANVGSTFTIEFTGPEPEDYSVTVTRPDGSSPPPTTGKFTPGPEATLDLGGGVQVKLSGVPGVGDTFVVEPASSPDYIATKIASASDATIGSPTVADYSKVRSGDVFTIEFTSATEYIVKVDNASATPTSETFPVQNYTPGRENTLTLPYGMQVKISGNPAASDTFTVQAATGPKTDLNIFDTLDSIIAALANPIQGNANATAQFQNTLATAVQRLDVNYNNVLTVRASVGSRMNELDALDANGSLRALSYSSQLSKMEDVDYYRATAQLQLRTSALEAAALAFRKIQATSLFNMGRN
ncbi:MAG TPA: flagellar hook-associated protein FlgL [Burkholderiaceae bacterium]|nr:flagellar hook-associated protein FlgL [Burkholderiaceae bacterium]